MDSITQAALGSLCGELLLRKHLGWKGAAWGAFFGTLPDLDILTSPWLDAMDTLRVHRSLSHSLFLMLILSPLFGKLLQRLHPQISAIRLTAFVLLAWSTHVLIDCFNSYGTQIFEPFSSYRLAFGNISIVDPFFTLPILLSNLICLFLLRQGRKRSILVYSTASWLCLYTIASFTLLAIARTKFSTQLQQAKIHTTDIHVSSTIGNIFLWRMVAKNPDNYYTSYWSVFDSPERPTSIHTLPRTPEITAPFSHSHPFSTLDWFSKGWWKAIPSSPDSIVMADLRFGEIHDLSQHPPLKHPPFLWKLTRQPDGSITEQRIHATQRPNMKLALSSLLERISGGAPTWNQARYPWEIPPKHKNLLPSPPQKH